MQDKIRQKLQKIQKLENSNSLDQKTINDELINIQKFNKVISNLENKINIYKKIQNLIDKVQIISGQIPKSRDKVIEELTDQGSNMKILLEGEKDSLWKKFNAEQAIAQFTLDVKLFEQNVNDCCQKLEKDISNNKQNEMLFKTIVKAIYGQHEQYKLEAKNSKFPLNRNRKETISNVEKNLKRISDNQTLSPEKKLRLIIGLLEKHKKAVAHNEDNKGILARLGSRNKDKGSRLVSKYDTILKFSKEQFNNQLNELDDYAIKKVMQEYKKFEADEEFKQITRNLDI
ncbi:MAG: hypothetical protein HRT87_04620 [Legionellales bacterium]|nr:hypothetical protein [Legionellales bacterium]